MQKIFFSIALVFFLTAAPALAAVSLSGSYDSFSGGTFVIGGTFFSSAFVFDGSGNSVGDALGCISQGSGNFSNQSIADLGGPSFSGAPGSYTLLVHEYGSCIGSLPSLNSFCGAGKTLTDCRAYMGTPPNNDYAGEYAFSISAPPAPSAPMFSLPSSSGDDLGGIISSLFSDPGTLSVIAVLGGLPLAFFVVHFLVGIVPGNKKAEREIGRSKKLLDEIKQGKVYKG